MIKFLELFYKSKFSREQNNKSSNNSEKIKEMANIKKMFAKFKELKIVILHEHTKNTMRSVLLTKPNYLLCILGN